MKLLFYYIQLVLYEKLRTLIPERVFIKIDLCFNTFSDLSPFLQMQKLEIHNEMRMNKQTKQTNFKLHAL